MNSGDVPPYADSEIIMSPPTIVTKCATCPISSGCGGWPYDSGSCLRGDDLAEIYILRLALSKGNTKIDYTAWLVEINEQPDGPIYFQLAHDDDWTKDHNAALHLSRREDAESIIEYYGWTSAKASEHMWPEPTTPAGMNDSDK